VQRDIGALRDDTGVRNSKFQASIPRSGNVVYLRCSGGGIPEIDRISGENTINDVAGAEVRCQLIDQTGQMAAKTNVWFYEKICQDGKEDKQKMAALEAELKAELR
jgi:hypothetical protein